jgi:membrane protease YdiL (CAAX protease family)
LKSLLGAWLLRCAGAPGWLLRADRADYAAFKELTRTADRQQRYRAWVLKSLAIFSGTTIVALAAIGRLGDLFAQPAEFAPLAHRLQSLLPASRAPDAAFFAALLGAIAMGAGIGALAAKRLGRTAKPVALGDIEALLPRNRAESFHVALLSANAGLSEELFFRLLLPLLLTLITGNAAFAFVTSALVFGLVHAYQGWTGVVATTVLGLALTALYLSTGSLWLVVAVHALLNLFGLLVRPLIGRPAGPVVPDGC